MKGFVSIGILCAALAALAGCGGGTNGPPPGALQRLGPLEGRLNLVVRPDYAQDSDRRRAVLLAAPFEQSTGCEVSSTVASSPRQVVRLLRSGEYDGVSARGNVSNALIAEGLVAPVNTDLIPAYDALLPGLKGQADTTVGGVTYGVPIGRAVSLLTWRPDQIPTNPLQPVSSDRIFDPSIALAYRGRITAPDDPMYIADAALYLRSHEPALEIDNIYELDQLQFDSAVALLKQQRESVGSYWRSPAENAAAFVGRGAVIGSASQQSVDRILRAGIRVRSAAPKEGTTGWSDNWMVAAAASHPNCMYRWISYASGALPNARLAESAHLAPANAHACDLTRDPAYCDTYMAANEEVFGDTQLWATPLRDCGDDRGAVCKSYADWARAWRTVIR